MNVSKGALALGAVGAVVLLIVLSLLNFFNPNYWVYGAVCGAIGAVIAGFMAAGLQPPAEEDRLSMKAPVNTTSYGLIMGLLAFNVVFVITRLVLYYGQPVFQGSLFGHWTVLLCVLVPACAIGLISSLGSKRAIVISALAAFALLVVPFFQYTWSAWGPGNAQKFAKLAKIETAGPGAQIPPSDPNHLVLVTQSIAQFKGQNRLGDLASSFHIDNESYTLQSVKGHRYWIAPLVIFNTKDVWTFGEPEAPGYVVVDAENPEAEAELKTGYHINLWPDQAWRLNLKRFMYLRGYTDGRFAKPKFEVDDNWQPYWVVSYIKKTFGGGTSGEVLSKVILVKLDSEPTISDYDPNNPEDRAKHAWVDRAMPSDLVSEYLSQWGYYDHNYARQNSFSNWAGFDKKETTQPAEIELSYTVGEENVYLVPMRSTNKSNNGVTGLVVYETNRNSATYYPELKGFNVPSSAINTLENAPGNAVNKYHVEHLQLVYMYGELTWVGIYAAPQKDGGKGFGGIGLMHAHCQSQAEVIYATDKATALQRYATQLGARRAGGNGKISQTAKPAPSITAKVVRIASLPSTVPTYLFKVEGDSHTFTVTRSTYKDIPFIKEGDVVTFTYLDTEDSEVPVTTFSCPAVDNIGVKAKK
jgi:hypothetical protein